MRREDVTERSHRYRGVSAMHPRLHARLESIRAALVAAHHDGGPSAVSGYVREQTFRQIILPSLPPQYRVTTGQIIDQYGGATGQLDAIVENGCFPSITAPSIADVRLVLAEGASCVVEVKSTLPSQWEQVLATRDKLSPIRRRFCDGAFTLGQVSERVPLFVVAYRGWSDLETLKTKTFESGVDGILVLEPRPLFAGRLDDDITGTEQNALWVFVCALHFRASQILSASCDLFAYGRGIIEP
jgi:hypothetical protein